MRHLLTIMIIPTSANNQSVTVQHDMIINQIVKYIQEWYHTFNVWEVYQVNMEEAYQ